MRCYVRPSHARPLRHLRGHRPVGQDDPGAAALRRARRGRPGRPRAGRDRRGRARAGDPEGPLVAAVSGGGGAAVRGRAGRARDGGDPAGAGACPRGRVGPLPRFFAGVSGRSARAGDRRRRACQPLRDARPAPRSDLPLGFARRGGGSAGRGERPLRGGGVGAAGGGAERLRGLDRVGPGALATGRRDRALPTRCTPRCSRWSRRRGPGRRRERARLPRRWPGRRTTRRRASSCRTRWPGRPRTRICFTGRRASASGRWRGRSRPSCSLLVPRIPTTCGCASPTARIRI